MTYSKITPYPSEVPLFLRVPSELKEKVKRLAAENKMSMNHYMTGLINSLEEKEDKGGEPRPGGGSRATQVLPSHLGDS